MLYNCLQRYIQTSLLKAHLIKLLACVFIYFDELIKHLSIHSGRKVS
jgi:hypothetical protein